MKKIIYSLVLFNILLLTSCIDFSGEIRWKKERTDWFPHHEGNLIFNDFLKKTEQQENFNFLVGFHVEDYPSIQGAVFGDYIYPSIDQATTYGNMIKVHIIRPSTPIPGYVSYEHTAQGSGLKFGKDAYNKRISIMAARPTNNEILEGMDISNMIIEVYVYSSKIFKTHKLVSFSPEVDLKKILKPNESLDDYTVSFSGLPYLEPFVERTANDIIVPDNANANTNISISTDILSKTSRSSTTESHKIGYGNTPKENLTGDNNDSSIHHHTVSNYPIDHASTVNYDSNSGKVLFNKKGAAHIILKRNAPIPNDAAMNFASSEAPIGSGYTVEHHVVILHDFKPFSTFFLMDESKKCVKFEDEDIYFSQTSQITRTASCDLTSVSKTSIPNNKWLYGWNGSLYTYNRNLEKIYAEADLSHGNKYFSGHVVSPHRGSDYFFMPYYGVKEVSKWTFENKQSTDKYYIRTTQDNTTLYVSSSAQATPNKGKVYGTSIKMEESKSNGGVFTLDKFDSMDFYYLYVPNDATDKAKPVTRYVINSVYPSTKMTYSYPNKLLQYKVDFPDTEKSIPVKTPIGLLDPNLFWATNEVKIKIPESRRAYRKNVFIDNRIIPYKNLKVLSVLPLDLKKTKLDSKYVEPFFHVGIRDKNNTGDLVQITVHHDEYAQVGNFMSLGSGTLKNTKKESSSVKVSLDFPYGLGPNDFVDPSKDKDIFNIGKNGRINSFKNIVFDFKKDDNIFLILGYDLERNYLFAGLADEKMVRDQTMPNMARIKVFPYIMDQLRDGFYTVVKVWTPGGASVDFNRPNIVYGDISSNVQATDPILKTQNPYIAYSEFILSMLHDPDLIFTGDFKSASRIKVLVEQATQSILYKINHTTGGSVSNFGEDYRFDINRKPSADSIIGRGVWIAKYKEKYGDFPYYSLYFHKYVKKTVKEYADIINSHYDGSKKSSLTYSGLYNFIFRTGVMLVKLDDGSSPNDGSLSDGGKLTPPPKSTIIKEKLLNFILKKAYRKASASVPSYFTNQSEKHIVENYTKSVVYMGLWTIVSSDDDGGTTYGTKNYTPTYDGWIREIDLRMVGIGEKVTNWGPFSDYYIFGLHYVPSARATMATALILLEKWLGKDYALAFYQKNGHNGFKLYQASLNVLKGYKAFYFPGDKTGFDPGIMMGKIAQLYYQRAKDSMTYGVSHVDNNIMKACDVLIPVDYVEDSYVIGGCLTYMMEADKRMLFNLQSNAISDWISGLDSEGPTFFQRFFKGFMYIFNIVMAFDMAEAIVEGMESLSSVFESGEDMLPEIEERGTINMDMNALSDENLLDDISMETQTIESKEVLDESMLTDVNDGKLTLEGCFP